MKLGVFRIYENRDWELGFDRSLEEIGSCRELGDWRILGHLNDMA